jgi:hypothetical protein
MGHIGLQQFATVVVILVLIGTRRWTNTGLRSGDWSQLSQELKRRMPVYSAETIHGKEAEFIRDRLPRRFPTLLALIAVLFASAAARWLTR